MTLGRFSGVFGIRGWLKVHAYTRPLENIFDYRRWWIAPPHGEEFEARLIEGRAQGRGLVAHVCDAAGEPLVDRERAAALVGADIRVERALLPPAAEGSYYWADLIGLAVESLGGAALGTVTGITDNGAQDVLVIQDGTQQRLIPFVRGPIVQTVDLAERRIVVDWEADY